MSDLPSTSYEPSSAETMLGNHVILQKIFNYSQNRDRLRCEIINSTIRNSSLSVPMRAPNDKITVRFNGTQCQFVIGSIITEVPLRRLELANSYKLYFLKTLRRAVSRFGTSIRNLSIWTCETSKLPICLTERHLLQLSKLLPELETLSLAGVTIGDRDHNGDRMQPLFPALISLTLISVKGTPETYIQQFVGPNVKKLKVLHAKKCAEDMKTLIFLELLSCSSRTFDEFIVDVRNENASIEIVRLASSLCSSMRIRIIFDRQTIPSIIDNLPIFSNLSHLDVTIKCDFNFSRYLTLIQYLPKLPKLRGLGLYAMYFDRLSSTDMQFIFRQLAQSLRLCNLRHFGINLLWLSYQTAQKKISISSGMKCILDSLSGDLRTLRMSKIYIKSTDFINSIKRMDDLEELFISDIPNISTIAVDEIIHNCIPNAQSIAIYVPQSVAYIDVCMKRPKLREWAAYLQGPLSFLVKKAIQEQYEFVNVITCSNETFHTITASYRDDNKLHSAQEEMYSFRPSLDTFQHQRFMLLQK